MAFILSPDMNLPVPIVGKEPGPDYAKDVNNSLNLIDSHDHSPGKGVPITPTGLNINAALSLQSNFLINVAGITFTPQTITPSLGTIYVNGVDLYYVDENNNNIRLTQNGGISGTSGSIANLTPPASASYVSGLSTFVWQSNTGIAANMDFGSATLRNLSPNSTFGLTLSPPAGLSSNYTITLPILPVSPSLLTIDNAGNMSASPLLNKGITAANIADGTLTTTQISPIAGILGTQLANDTVGIDEVNASVLQWNTTTVTASGTFTVPIKANRLQIVGVGGGGGGGGCVTSAAGAGGGGGGSTPMSYSIPVTSGDVLSIVIGAGGGGGGPGVSGAGGGNSTLTYPTGSLLFMGGTSGATGISGAGGSTFYVPVYSVGPAPSGGSGGANVAGSPGNPAFSTLYVPTGAAGGAPGGMIGGGGGGSGLGAGGVGGQGIPAGAPQDGFPGVNKGSGGGGSGATNSFTGFGSGGAGADGAIVISWLGHA